MSLAMHPLTRRSTDLDTPLNPICGGTRSVDSQPIGGLECSSPLHFTCPGLSLAGLTARPVDASPTILPGNSPTNRLGLSFF